MWISCFQTAPVGQKIRRSPQCPLCGVALKRILCLSRKKPVHAADLARDLGVSRPTVSVFLKQLQRDGYVTVGAHHIITLTPKGMDIAKQTLQRHQTIQLLLEGLGVPREIASADACAIEHELSPQSFEAIKCFTKAKK